MKNIRLIILITLIATLAVNAVVGQPNDLERKISLVASDKTITEVLAQITELSQISFSYSKEELPSEKVNLAANNETIGHVLDRLLTNAGLEYQQLSGLVAIRKIKRSDGDSYLSCSGTVVDAENNEPLAFASIGVLKQAKGTITNTSGSFELRLPPGFKSDTLLISMVGYH